jgi:Enoyl-(Acyl carrier protein) reductase
VTPGPIDTPIVGKVFTGKDEAAQIREKMAAMVPMKRWGTSEEIAKAVLFLSTSFHKYGLVLSWLKSGRRCGILGQDAVPCQEQAHSLSSCRLPRRPSC